MFIFYKELTLEEGFSILELCRRKRIVDNVRVSAPSGAALWLKYKDLGEPITCWECGVTADRFILRHHRNDCNKPPILELFAHTGKSLVMMTRDHIIPSSLGGINDVANLRPGCETCNRDRKSKMNIADTIFMNNNPHLYIKKI